MNGFDAVSRNRIEISRQAGALLLVTFIVWIVNAGLLWLWVGVSRAYGYEPSGLEILIDPLAALGLAAVLGIIVIRLWVGCFSVPVRLGTGTLGLLAIIAPIPSILFDSGDFAAYFMPVLLGLCLLILAIEAPAE